MWQTIIPMQGEWFRRETWSAEDQAEFHARLKRARASSKAQYLRIQSAHLQQAGGAELVRAALELLDLLLREFPAPSELAAAHGQRAECLRMLGRAEDALGAYRDALAAERTFANLRTNAYLGFGELVLSLGRQPVYAEVESVFGEFGTPGPTFPALEFRFAVVLACIADERRDRVAAARWATAALVAAAKAESPFRFHRDLGLVGQVHVDLESRLRKLAAG